MKEIKISLRTVDDDGNVFAVVIDENKCRISTGTLSKEQVVYINTHDLKLLTRFLIDNVEVDRD